MGRDSDVNLLQHYATLELTQDGHLQEGDREIDECTCWGNWAAKRHCQFALNRQCLLTQRVYYCVLLCLVVVITVANAICSALLGNNN